MIRRKYIETCFDYFPCFQTLIKKFLLTDINNIILILSEYCKECLVSETFIYSERNLVPVQNVRKGIPKTWELRDEFGIVFVLNYRCNT